MGDLGRRLSERYSLAAMVSAYRELILGKSGQRDSAEPSTRPQLASSGT